MTEYIATFYTHAGAIVGHRELTRSGISARMAPVPRRVSSSCGTCVFFEAASAEPSYFPQDLEAIYRAKGGRYSKVFDADEEQP